jgi:predicted TIM-barrel fold metal-dependent hydrolase
VHEKIESSLAGATEEQRRRILWENAAELYRVELPGPVRARS